MPFSLPSILTICSGGHDDGNDHGDDHENNDDQKFHMIVFLCRKAATVSSPSLEILKVHFITVFVEKGNCDEDYAHDHDHDDDYDY